MSGGSRHPLASSCRCEYSVASFRGKFVAGLHRAFAQHQLGFYGECQPLAEENAFAAFIRTLFRQDWVVYAKKSRLLAAQITSCSTWLATPIVWPSPIIASCRWTTAASASDGKTTPITASAA